jgi:hypothetical protein
MAFLAWDLSRYLVATAFSAMLAILYMQQVQPVPTRALVPRIACWGVSLIGLFIPLVYAYFEVATVVAGGFIPFTRMPIGSGIERAVEFYSRNIAPAVVAETGTEDPPGTVWYEEEDTWLNVWTRRPGKNIFDSTGCKLRVCMTSVQTVTRNGNRIIVVRTNASDGNNLMLTGTLKGSYVEGTYPGGKWFARISDE